MTDVPGWPVAFLHAVIQGLKLLLLCDSASSSVLAIIHIQPTGKGREHSRMCICFLRDVSLLCSYFTGELDSSTANIQTPRLGHVAILGSHFPAITPHHGRRNTNAGGKAKYLCHILCPLSHNIVPKCHIKMESNPGTLTTIKP